MNRGKIVRTFGAAIGVLFLVAGLPARAQSRPVATFHLSAGRGVFWNGPTGLSETVPIPHEARQAICAAGGPGCLDYRLVVSERGARLRVGIDMATDLDVYEGEFLAIYLIRPDGSDAGHFGFPDLFFSWEIAADRPAPGAWTLRIVPFFARKAGPFRLRARLDPVAKTASRPKKVSTLLPNLRMTPPFEFTLKTPAFIGAYGPMGADIGPLRGVPPTSGCLPAEIATYHSRRCLRFSTGPENIGPGRLRITYRPDGSSLTDGPAFQELDRTDGSSVEVRAGSYTYHLQHLHYHHSGFAGFTLFRVNTRTHALTPAGSGPKQGFCIAGQRLVDWRSWNNQLRDAVPFDCISTGTLPMQDSHMGLARGWADNYVYSQEGMFVDFGDNPDGLYVLRVRANARDAMHETTTRDNDSYAYLRITGTNVTLLERGYGTSPWDRKKRIVHDLALATADD